MVGERIRQARLLTKFTQDALADALTQARHPATKAVISKYENNKGSPSEEFLLLVASILGVPVSYFTHEAALEVQWLAFRRSSKLKLGEQAAVKAYAADVAKLQIELQSLLYPNASADLPAIVAVSTLEEAEQAAGQLRDCWELDDHPIDSLVQTAEHHQVVVVGWHDDTGKFDGLSGWGNEKYPVTVISTRVGMDRRRFTLAHELGHLVMDTSAVSEKEAETLAHRFSAALLVPAERARHELGARRTRLDWDELGILKRKYGLSMAAWVYRAKDLEIITERHAKSLWQDLSKRGWRTQEPVEYFGDESPVQLDQMAHRAVAEGLISPDQIQRVYPQWDDHSTVQARPDRFTVYDLLAMPEAEQERVMAEAFALAAQEDFEIFEANEFLEEDETMA